MHIIFVINQTFILFGQWSFYVLKMHSFILRICGTFLCFVCNQAQGQGDLSTLKLVQLYFRHGESAPDQPYPNDPLKDSSIWPNGWGQLTNEGKQQAYKLGQYLRTRYSTFLNASYVPNQIISISSETDRTMMSALLVMAGLYPTNNESNWNNAINWQPVPIRTIFAEHDNLIGMARPCPMYQKLLEDFLTDDPKMREIHDENKELFERLSKHTGIDIKTVNDLELFYATLSLEEQKGLDIPEWGRQLKDDPNFQYLYNLSFKARTYTNDLKRLRTGELTKFLVENINERVRNESSKTKIFALSGHSNLLEILNTFGVLDLQASKYSSAFLLELHQNTSGTYYVELYLRNVTDREPYALKMPECNFQCPIDTFIKYVKPFIPEDWEKECKIFQPGPSHHFTNVYSYLLLSILIITVAFFLFNFAYMSMKNKRRSVYQRTEYQML